MIIMELHSECFISDLMRMNYDNNRAPFSECFTGTSVNSHR